MFESALSFTAFVLSLASTGPRIWEAHFLHDGELAHGQRFVRKEGAVEEAESQRPRLLREAGRRRRERVVMCRRCRRSPR